MCGLVCAALRVSAVFCSCMVPLQTAHTTGVVHFLVWVLCTAFGTLSRYLSVSFPRRSHQAVKSPVSGGFCGLQVVAASCSCAFPFYSLLGAPTLSRLLEAGPAQFTSPLASFSAVASEPPAKLLPPPVEPVSQATIVMMPTLSAPAVVPPAAAPESVATGAFLNYAELRAHVLLESRTSHGISTLRALSWAFVTSDSLSWPERMAVAGFWSKHGFRQGFLGGGGGAGDLPDWSSRVGVSLCLSCGKSNPNLSFINLSFGGVGGPGMLVLGVTHCSVYVGTSPAWSLTVPLILVQ